MYVLNTMLFSELYNSTMMDTNKFEYNIVNKSTIRVIV